MSCGDGRRCPSSECRAGAVLLGVVLPNGRIAYAADRIVVDQGFVDIARQGRAPEKRFRFSGPCVEGACPQWSGHDCGLIDRLLTAYEAERGPAKAADPLPACSIREECRWFDQHAGRACAVCPEVVTDSTEAAEQLPPRVASRRSMASGTRS